MNDPLHSAADDQRYRAPVLIRRLFLEQGLSHWRRYAIAFALMGIAAGCTALSAYLSEVREATESRNSLRPKE